jgi:hypothetical protein
MSILLWNVQYLANDLVRITQVRISILGWVAAYSTACVLFFGGKIPPILRCAYSTACVLFFGGKIPPIFTVYVPRACVFLLRNFPPTTPVRKKKSQRNTKMDISFSLIDSSANIVAPIIDKGLLDVTKTESLRLTTFFIKTVTVSPHNQATIEIGIVTDSGRTIYRGVTLVGEAYKLWGDNDDFLYEYVRANIDEIYANY